MYNWQTNIRYVKTIGPVKAAELKGIGIETVGDLLEYKPLDYQYPGVTAIKDLPSEGRVMIRAKITYIQRTSNRPIVNATLSDDDYHCITVTWWNQVFIVQHLRTGMTATFWGKIKNGTLQQPKFSTLGTTEDVSGGLYGVHTDTIRKALKEVLDNVEIPEWGVEKAPLRKYTFQALHFPDTKQQHISALKLLKFNELLLMQLAVLKKRKQSKQKSIPIYTEPGGTRLIKYTGEDWFPFKFTDEQQQAKADIVLDLISGKPMNRLLHGEVGSGKTAVAFYAAMLTALNKKRTLILCPTTILADQHWNTLWDMGWHDIALYCSGEEKQKADWYKSNIIIGTHAILHNKELLQSASLVIVDEFQKFGVEQRATLQRYGNPHILLMSATPIPRSLAMTVFGDLDMSTIRELPIKRGTVVTRWIHPDKREGMYEVIDAELKKGHQAYVVYPRIDGGEDTVNAIHGFVEICKRFNNQDNIDLLTGKDTPSMKKWSLRQFRSGQTRILVSTIIAEVGLDCPNATVMVVEGADRFGLSNLHQLRGRICRSTDTAFCFLVAETANQKSIDRLDVMEKCNDGFEIAEHDLRLRGPGEMFSTRQHGLPDLKFASILDDYELLVKAKDAAVEIYDKLDSPEYSGLKEMLEIKYSETLKLAGVA